MFNEIYLITDARTIFNNSFTRREIDIICDLIPIKPNQNILDLCGGYGRHSIELHKRGFESCTVADYSSFLINMGKNKSQEFECAINFIRCDARKIAIKSEYIDHVIILGNALGYLNNIAGDLDILFESHRVLQKGGWIVLEITDGSAMKNSFVSNSWNEIGNEYIVCRERDLNCDTIFAREMVISKMNGLMRDQTYAIKLYDSDSLAALLRQAGFQKIKVHRNPALHQLEGDYGFLNNRMIATGQKL